MNDDYLWDKTGEPDPEIQQLEQILGTLRYQPKPLELPERLQVPQRRSYLPWLAIAASVLLAIVAGSIWLRVRTRNGNPPEAQVKQPPAVEKSAPAPVGPTGFPKAPEHKSVSRDESVAVNVKHRNRSTSSTMAKREREEALQAKEQLMIALRLASEKLSLLHKKSQSTAPANQIKNQHRIG